MDTDTREKRFVEGALDLYTFARNTLPKEGFDRTWKVALVRSPDDDSHDFLETASQNVGYQVMVFKNSDDAMAWLGEGKSAISKSEHCIEEVIESECREEHGVDANPG